MFFECLIGFGLVLIGILMFIWNSANTKHRKLITIKNGEKKLPQQSIILSQNQTPQLKSYRIDEECSNFSRYCLSSRKKHWKFRPTWRLSIEKGPENGPIIVDKIAHVVEILTTFDIDCRKGFLPKFDPLHRLPHARYHIWEDLADDIPKFLGARLGTIRGPLSQLPVLSIDLLTTLPELYRAHLLLSLFAHAYVWGGETPAEVIPKGIAIPLCQVSTLLDLPPVLGNTDIVLNNWRRLDPQGEISMNNLATLNNFFDGRDESWFYLVTVEIEAKGAKSLLPYMLLLDAILRYFKEKDQRRIQRRSRPTLSNVSHQNNDQHNRNEIDRKNQELRRRFQIQGEEGEEPKHNQQSNQDQNQHQDNSSQSSSSPSNPSITSIHSIPNISSSIPSILLRIREQEVSKNHQSQQQQQQTPSQSHSHFSLSPSTFISTATLNTDEREEKGYRSDFLPVQDEAEPQNKEEEDWDSDLESEDEETDEKEIEEIDDFDRSECKAREKEEEEDCELRGRLSGVRVARFVAFQLRFIQSAIKEMAVSMRSMREGCEPFIFFHRVRPFLAAWKHNPTLPTGVIYEGVFENKRQQFYGGSAGQSTLIPFLDLALGIQHDNPKSREFLLAMRAYMAKGNRQFLEYLEHVSCLREYVLWGVQKYLIDNPVGGRSKTANESGSICGASSLSSMDHIDRREKRLSELREVWESVRLGYNACAEAMREFRDAHMVIVSEYIIAQQRRGTLPKQESPVPSSSSSSSDSELTQSHPPPPLSQSLPSIEVNRDRERGRRDTAGGKGTGGQDLVNFLAPLRNKCRESVIALPHSTASDPQVQSETNMQLKSNLIRKWKVKDGEVDNAMGGEDQEYHMFSSDHSQFVKALSPRNILPKETECQVESSPTPRELWDQLKN